MTMSDRGVHPDLAEEIETTRAAEGDPPPPEAASRGGRRGRSSQRPAPEPEPSTLPPGEVVSGEPEAAGDQSAADGDPEWMRAVREAKAAPDALATILKNVPLEELQKHPQISGWIGNMAQRVSREQAVREQADQAERDKFEAWKRGDYYRVGELSAPELEARALQAQQAQASEPFMQSVTEYQRTLPEAVQLEIQGKNYTSMADYLKAAHDASVRYDVDQRVQDELKKRAPALNKAALSATVGAEPSPERDGGPSPRGREITDVELALMSNKETEMYLDDRGRPLPGVTLRLTRGVDVTRR